MLKTALLAVGLFVPILLFLSFFIYFNGRIFPNNFVAGIDLSGKTVAEAESIVSESFAIPKEIQIEVAEAEIEPHTIPTEAIAARLDARASVAQAYSIGRSGNFLADAQQIINTLIQKNYFDGKVTIDRQALKEQLAAYEEAVTTTPIYPTVALSNGLIIVSQGESGTALNTEQITQTIVETLEQQREPKILAHKETVDVKLSSEEVLAVEERAIKLLDKELIFEFEFERYIFSPERLITFIDPHGDYLQDVIASEVAAIAEQLNREPQNSVFSFSDGKVKEFTPAKQGVAVQQGKLLSMFRDALTDLELDEFETITYSVPVEATEPAITTEEVNNLGIKELIGRGTSTFRGSIPSRVYNIQLAASRINGTLIKPGEDFSFNAALGDVSALTGYKQAYIIQGNQTVLGDGGGVCQVSTTFFRSALNAGLPILERNPHSYRVGYYEQDSLPGVDASIYVPTLDLKIKNDTPGHILIQTNFDAATSSLVFELYGTSDGRTAEISKPVITSTSPAPEPLYIDDPNLPTGRVQQIDYAAAGARVFFDYKVTRDGETIYEKTFNSNYRPWQAKFLRGTGPAV